MIGGIGILCRDLEGGGECGRREDVRGGWRGYMLK